MSEDLVSALERPAVYYSDQAREAGDPLFGWFMETPDPHENRAWIMSHVDAILVTNAYTVLDSTFMQELQRVAGR